MKVLPILKTLLSLGGQEGSQMGFLNLFQIFFFFKIGLESLDQWKIQIKFRPNSVNRC